jgi:hypothetical protein
MDGITNLLAAIAALTDQIGPLGGKQRGMPIESDEWNTLVSVLQGLLTLLRTQETSLQTELQAEFAPIVHFHTGQVAVDWLDADLQSRLAGGGAGGVATRLSLADMQVKLDALGGQVGQLSTLGEDLQTRLDRTVADGLQQATKLTGFDQRFSGIEDLRGLVTGLSAQVGGLQPGIDAVLALRQSLGDVDVAGLQQRVVSLEALGKNLLGADGSPVHLTDVEARVKQLEDTLEVSPGSSLDDRVANLRKDLETALDKRVDDGLATVGARVDAATADARASVESELASRLDETKSALEQNTAELVATAQQSLETSFAARVETATADLRTSLSTEAASLVDQRLATLPAQISDAAKAAVGAAVSPLRDTLAQELGSQLDARISASDAALTARADALDAKLADRDAQLPQLVAAEAAAELPDLVAGSVANASSTLAAGLGARVDQQLAQARDGLAATVQENVSTSLTAALGDLDARISAQLAPQLAGLDDRIQSAAAAAVGDLDSRVADAVRSQLDSRLTDLGTQLTQQWQADLQAGLQRAAADNAQALSSALDGIRGEIATSHDDALHTALDAVDRTQASVEAEVKSSSDALTSQLARSQAGVQALSKNLAARLTALERVVKRPPGVAPSIGTRRRAR